MKDQAFFLPIETRPKQFPPLKKMVGKFWHAGIIHNGKIYECFDQGRNSIKDFDEAKKEELEKMKAIFVDIIADKNKIDSEIGSGTDCSEYVARVVGLSSNTGPKKEYWPEEVYEYILKTAN
jgi:hypothetical protein